jgi:hypothetical protein
MGYRAALRLATGAQIAGSLAWVGTLPIGALAAGIAAVGLRLLVH